MGLFEADKDKSEFNQMLQVFSRFTWQLPSTLTGYGLASFYNDTRRLDDVECFHGATVLVTDGIGSAVSISGFIIINPKYGDIDYNNSTLLHEYGHFIQTRKWGGLAYNPVMSSSFASAALDWRSSKKHNDTWTERDANARTLKYFNGKLNKSQENAFIAKYGEGSYYDSRFYRNYIYHAPLIYFIYDITWSD